MTKRILVVTIALFLLVAPSVFSSDIEHRILILHSYHQGSPWTDHIMEGMMGILQSDEYEINIHTEYLDALRTPKELWPNFEDYLKSKYAGVDFDLILASDDDVLDFLIPRYEDWFPTTPIVFCAINNLDEDLFKKHKTFKGINQEINVKETIEFALKLKPNTEKFLVISDRTSGGISTTKKFKEDIKEFNHVKPKFELIDDFTLPELKTRLNELGPKDLVLVLRLQAIRGIDERSPTEFTKLITDLSPVPAFKVWGTGKTDYMGGVYVSSHAQGKTAARIAIRILGGESPQNIPQVTKSPNVPTLNYSILEKFKIDKELIPEGTLIINQPDTFWVKYRIQIMFVLAVFVILCMVIIFMIYIYSKLYRETIERKSAQDQVLRTLSEKETLLNELYHRILNTLQVIQAMLGLHANQDPDNDGVQNLVQDTENRILTIALVHQKLYQSQNLSQINFMEYLRELSELIMKRYGVEAQQIELQIDGDENIDVLLDTAIPCGLIINELLSNTLKYAFPAKHQGRISIRVIRNGAENIEISYADTGVGVPPGFDFRGQKTLGIQTIFSIAESQLQGKVTFASEQGVTCTIEFPELLYTERV